MGSEMMKRGDGFFCWYGQEVEFVVVYLILVEKSNS